MRGVLGAGERDLDPGANASLANLRKAAALTGIVGAIFAVLFIASLWVLHLAPRPRDADQVYVDFYASDDRQKIVLVGLYVLPFSAVAFIWFIAALRQWVTHSRRRGSQMIGAVQLISGIAFITLALASAAASTMPAALTEFTDAPVSADVARDFPLYGSALLLIFGVRLAAMFVMATTKIAMTIGFMPRWFGLMSLAVALVLFLSATLSVWLAVLFPVWVLAFGILIIVLAYRTGVDSPLLRELRTVGAVDLPSGDDVISA